MTICYCLFICLQYWRLKIITLHMTPAFNNKHKYLKIGFKIKMSSLLQAFIVK